MRFRAGLAHERKAEFVMPGWTLKTAAASSTKAVKKLKAKKRDSKKSPCE